MLFRSTALATCFPLATAVGITRCDVVLGNLLHHLQAVVYNTLLLAGMLVLEGATGGWFINQPIFGTGLLDHGSCRYCSRPGPGVLRAGGDRRRPL